MQRQFVELTCNNGKLYIDVAQIQAVMEYSPGSRIFVKGSDDPFPVKETPEEVFESMGYQKEKDE